MSGLRHPLSGAVYDITPQGEVEVTTEDSSGLFDRERRVDQRRSALMRPADVQLDRVRRL